MSKDILDIINSDETKAELNRIQIEMYSMGRIDALKSVISCLDDLSEHLFTKDNVLTLLRGVLPKPPEDKP